jgi:hypothetical protein
MTYNRKKLRKLRVDVRIIVRIKSREEYKISMPTKMTFQTSNDELHNDLHDDKGANTPSRADSGIVKKMPGARRRLAS